MTKLTETQTIILSAGAQRPENIALPLPKGLHGAAAKMAVTKMIEHCWLQEVDDNLRRGEPHSIWSCNADLLVASKTGAVHNARLLLFQIFINIWSTLYEAFLREGIRCRSNSWKRLQIDRLAKKPSVPMSTHSPMRPGRGAVFPSLAGSICRRHRL
jgi:hypothetical protein